MATRVRRLRLPALLFAAFVSASCASYTAQPLRVRAPNRYSTHLEQGGVTVGVEPYFTPEKTAAILGEDVTEGFMPVLVSVRNDTGEFVVVPASDMRLVSAEGASSRPVPWQNMYQSFKHDVMDETFTLGVFGGVAAEDANDEMADDWSRKQFPEHATLTQGKGAGGLVYFRKAPGAGPFSIVVSVQKMKSEEVVEVRVPLDSP